MLASFSYDKSCLTYVKKSQRNVFSFQVAYPRIKKIKTVLLIFSFLLDLLNYQSLFFREEVLLKVSTSFH